MHEIVDSELFGAGVEERMFGTAEIAEYGAQGVAQHFAALAERGLHNAHEQSLVACQMCGLVAAQPDDGTLDLRWRIENLFRHGKQIVDVVPSLQKYAQNAVFARPRWLGYADCHFALNHPDAFGYDVAIFNDFEKYLRRDVVREIADDSYALRESLRKIHF